MRLSEDSAAWFRTLFEASLAAVSASTCLPQHLPAVTWPGRTVVLSVGKAAAEMAAVACKFYGPHLEGLVVYPPGHGVESGRLGDSLELIEAGHPVPDSNSLRAAKRALAIAASLGANDRLIALISGGGSALLALPADGVTLDDKRALTKALLASGASISEMNCVRKHLSQIKGGRLALAAAPAIVHTYLISDIPGDNPALTASGPTLADSQTLADARAVLARLDLVAPPAIKAALADAANETPDPKDPAFDANSAAIIARAGDAFWAAQVFAGVHDVEVTFLGDTLEGPAHLLGKAHGKLALSASNLGRPKLILSGGETSVALNAGTTGRGGRNLEYLLALAIALDGAEDIFALACDSDGIDGTSSAAGAIVTPTTLQRARTLGLDAQASLTNHQSHAFFEALGDLVITGPTRTNVNDFRAILVR